MLLGLEVGLRPGDFVLDGNPAPFPKKGAQPPNFRLMFIVAKRLDGSRWHLPPPNKGGPRPQFSVHFYCGQTAECIKMPLGMDVGLSPGDFVLDGEPVRRPDKGAEPPSPIFGPFL